jgi:hypothetical protein
VTPEASRRWLIARDFSFVGNATIYHRQRLIDAGGFRPELGPFCDGFIMQVLALRHGACIVQEGLAAGRWTGSNFASSTLSDPQRSLAVHDAVLALIQGEFASLFPPEYIARWRRRSLYAIARTMFKGVDHDVAAHLESMSRRASGVDAVLLRVLSSACSFAMRAAFVALACVLRRRDVLRLVRAATSRRAIQNRAVLRRLGA